MYSISALKLLVIFASLLLPQLNISKQILEVAVVQSNAQQTIYHGNVESKIFHKPSCRYYKCKNCTAKFSSREAAIKAGYRPCKVFKP